MGAEAGTGAVLPQTNDTKGCQLPPEAEKDAQELWQNKLLCKPSGLWHVLTAPLGN